MRDLRDALCLAAVILACQTGIAEAQDLAQGNIPAVRDAARAGPFQQTQLDANGAMIAYHRFNGTMPDFRRYAERSQAYQKATAFDRDQVRAREVARLETEFQRFDTRRPYLARLSTTLAQYDMGRRGYSLPLNETSYVNLYDSVTGRQFGIQFRNPEEANFISFPDVAAARAFAQRNNLDMQNSTAASVVLELVFRLVEAVPETGGSGPQLLRADIVAARAMKENAALYEFRVTPPASPKPEAVAAAGLRAADIQGVRLGMARAEAEALAATTYRAAPEVTPEGAAAYFDGPGDVADRRCGVERGPGMPAQQPDGTPTFFTVPDSAAACLSFQAAQQGGISLVTSGQRLETATREQVQAALTEKYGPPGAILEGGSLLIWKGVDPAAPGAPPVQINARIQEVGTGALKVLLLGIELRPTVPQQGTRPAPRAGGPRL